MMIKCDTESEIKTRIKSKTHHFQNWNTQKQTLRFVIIVVNNALRNHHHVHMKNFFMHQKSKNVKNLICLNVVCYGQEIKDGLVLVIFPLFLHISRISFRYKQVYTSTHIRKKVLIWLLQFFMLFTLFTVKNLS